MEDWPVVGRDELADEVLSRLGEGGRHGIVLLGEAGVGKTTLARRIAELAEPRGGAVLRVAGDESSTSIPLAGLGHLLPADLARRSMVDGRMDSGAMYHLARSELAELTGGERILLVADDANWLDELSLALIGQLARTGDITLLATVRGAAPPAGTLERLVSDGVLATVTVPALSPRDVRELLRRALGPVGEGIIAARLVEVSGGVPLFLRELIESSLAAGALDLSAGRWSLLGQLQPSSRLGDLVEARLRDLDAPQRRVLEALAVAGELSLGLAAEIAPMAVLEELEAHAHIEVRTSGRRHYVAVAHPLHGEVLRAHLPALRAQQLRRTLAEAIEGWGARRRQDPMRVATWRLEAGLDVRPEILVEAARLSIAAHDHEAAERMARRVWESERDPEAGVVLLGAIHRLGRADEVEELAKALSELDLTDEQLVTVARLRSLNLFFMHGSGSGADVIEEALERIAPSADRERLRAHLAELYVNMGFPQRALEAAEGVVLTDTPSVQVELAGALAMASSMVGRPDDGRAAAEAGLALIDADPTGQFDQRSWLTVNVFIALTFEGRVDEAAELADHARTSALARGARAAALWFGHWNAWVGIHRGDVDTCIEHGSEFLSWAREQDSFANERWTVALVAMAHLLRGDREAARPFVDRAVELEIGGRGLFHPDIDRAIVWLAMADGRQDDAMARLRTSAESSRERGRVVLEALSLHDLVRMGRPGDVADRLDELAVGSTSPLVTTLAAQARALTARDAPAMGHQVDELERLGFRWMAAEGAALHGRLLTDLGQQRSAAAAFQRSEQLAVAIGGLRTPPMQHHDVDALTPRERETALLAANGLASKEIASRLAVSTRTVDTHLARVYTKLGIGGRADLADALGID